MVIKQAKTDKWREHIETKFVKKFYAGSTWATKATKRSKVASILEAMRSDRDGAGPPFTVDDIMGVAAALNETNFRAADQYLSELKLWQVEAGHQWNDCLERQMTLCKRALRRDVGPEKRAKEVRIDELADDKWSEKCAGKHLPVRTTWSYVCMGSDLDVASC